MVPGWLWKGLVMRHKKTKRSILTAVNWSWMTHTECKVRILDQFYLQRTDSVYPLIVLHKKRRSSIKLLQLPAIYARKARSQLIYLKVGTGRVVSEVTCLRTVTD
jgi:hypothetical protein